MGVVTALESRAVAAAETREPSAVFTFTETAFADFYGRTRGALWRYLRRTSGDEALADDLLQESYVKILHAKELPAEERPRVAYLYRIATNLLRDRWRRDEREAGWLRRLFASPERPSGERLETRLDFDGVLETVSQKERALLWLAYVEGFEHKEIAQFLGLKVGSVKVLLFRARKRLARTLEERGLGHDRRKS